MARTNSSMGVVQAGLLALGQLGDPRLRGPLLKSLGLTLIAFMGLWAGIGWLIAHTRFFETAWLDLGAGALSGIAAVLLSIVLFPSAVAAFLGLFLEDVAAAVEARHYPGLPAPKQRPMIAEIGSALRLLVLAVTINLVVLPLYLVPGLNLVVFLATNGFLLAREYVTMSAARRVDSRLLRRLWRERRSQAWLAGAAIAALSTIPIVNLTAPVVAVAMTTHLIEAWRKSVEEGPE